MIKGQAGILAHKEGSDPVGRGTSVIPDREGERGGALGLIGQPGN